MNDQLSLTKPVFKIITDYKTLRLVLNNMKILGKSFIETAHILQQDFIKNTPDLELEHPALYAENSQILSDYALESGLVTDTKITFKGYEIISILNDEDFIAFIDGKNIPLTVDNIFKINSLILESKVSKSLS